MDIWITNETPARALFVKGRSGIDPDCLVAYLEDDPHGKPLWIVDKPDGTGHVCGLNDVEARRIIQQK
jgi:hypothetical protein